MKNINVSCSCDRGLTTQVWLIATITTFFYIKKTMWLYSHFVIPSIVRYSISLCFEKLPLLVLEKCPYSDCM